MRQFLELLPPEEVLRMRASRLELGAVLLGDRSLVDLTAETGYPVSGWPTLVVIDQEMVLQHGINGWNEATVRGWVQGLL